jgi:hypothetical protein
LSIKTHKTYYLNILSSNSGNWEYGYSTLSANSAVWDNNTNIINDLTSSYNSNSGNWDSTYLTVCANSAGWGDLFAITILSSNSAKWNEATELKPL